MHELLRNLTHAVRSLRKSPGFALSALAILTLGIGANTAIFGIVNTVLLKPLPFPDPGSIVTIFHVPPAKAFPGIKTFAVSAANYLDWRKQSRSFESMAIVGFRGIRLTGGTRPESLVGSVTESGFFDVVRVKPEVGRAFGDDETKPGKDSVAVVSNGFALSHFGSPQNAVGQSLEMNNRKYQVIGVMPRDFQLKSWLPASTDLWLPIAWTPEEAAVRGNHNYLVVARLRKDVPLEKAQSEMNVISDRLARDYPEEDKGWGAVVTSLRDNLVGDVRPALLTLLGAVGFVLLIACANTANLVLARTITRRKELAIRAALGASANQVLRPVLLETTLLAVCGGVLGLLLARYGQALVLRALAGQLPRATEVHLDAQVLGFTLVASIATGLAAGLIAGLRMLRLDLNDALKQGTGKTDTDSGGKRTRSALVTAEVALSLILLVGAGLMIRSLWALQRVDPGFVPSQVITMTVPIPPTSEGTRRSLFYDAFLPRVRALPGVAAAAAIDNLPLNGGSQQPITVEGKTAEVFALQPNVAVRRITPGYLQTMRIPLISGRDLTEADTTGEKPVVLISQSMARQFFPGENPIGKRLRISFTPQIVREVAGVVGDVKDRGLDSLQPVSMLYEPQSQSDRGYVSLAIRGDMDPSAIVPAVTRVLQQINRDLPIRKVETMDQLLANSLSKQRFTMFLLAALAGLAFALATVGIYSVLAYSVRSRAQEIGVRMALGASVQDVLRLVVFEGMRPALLGVVCGAFGAWLVSGILQKLVFGVSPTDPLTFASVASLLLIVALLSCLIPAFRASRVEPVTALRNE